MALLHSRIPMFRASRLCASLRRAQCCRQWLPQRRSFTRSTAQFISDHEFIQTNLDKAILDNGQDLRPSMGFEPEPEVVNQEKDVQRPKSLTLKDRLRKGSRKPSMETTQEEQGEKDIPTILGHPRNKPMRTRFAPSPTGDMHLGSLKTALVNQLLAKSTSRGTFVLRIEDTDQSREVDNSQQTIMNDLKWLGLEWSEGPDIGGPHGPYLQSKRLHIYKPYVEKLIEQGHAYRCFCTSQDLQKQKQDAHKAGHSTKYPGTCRHVPATESSERAAKNEPHVVRFKGDQFGILGFVDAVKGKFQKAEAEDDFVIWKTDGFPTYHLANVVDDHLMKITHVVRGDEWLVSTPKHLALYRALGWGPPTFAHLGLLFDKDGKKLSKRHKDGSVQSYKDQSQLPLVMANWLAHMDFAFESGHDALTIPEMSNKLPSKILSRNNVVNTNNNIFQDFQRKGFQRILGWYTTYMGVDPNEQMFKWKAPVLRDLKTEWGPAMETIARITREGESYAYEQGKTTSKFAPWLRDLKLTTPLQDLAHDSSWSDSSFNYMLRTYRTLNGGKVPLLSELIFTSPWIFWQPPLALQRLWVARTALEPSKDSKGFEPAALSVLCKTFDPVNGYPNWEDFFLNDPKPEDPFRWTLSQSDSPPVDDLAWAKILSQCHVMMRLVLTGNTGRRPHVRSLIRIVGIEECRARLRVVEGLFEELRVGGEALAKTWIEEGEALDEEGQDPQNAQRPVEAELEKEAKP